MNAVFLKAPDGTETSISICTACGAPARGKTNFDISEKCCTCYDCGLPLNSEDRSLNRMYHRSCEDKRRAKIESDRLDRAELIEDYDGPVYFDGGHGSFGDGYFADVDELAEWLDDQEFLSEGDSRPEFAHCCIPSRVACIDIDRVLENETEESFEDAIDHLNGIEQLRAAVAIFNEANKDVLSWDWDMKRKVKVPEFCVNSASNVPSEPTKQTS